MSYVTLQELQHMKEERERCKNTYPDWKDDKFNCLDNKFIFAIKSSEDHSDEEPSFHTLNDFTIYYNRKSKLYFLELDIPINYGLQLDDMQDKFKAFILSNYSVEENCLGSPIKLSDIDITQGFDLFSAKTLQELYRKFKFFVSGINCGDYV